jgi:hypothetical protein
MNLSPTLTKELAKKHAAMMTDGVAPAKKKAINDEIDNADAAPPAPPDVQGGSQFGNSKQNKERAVPAGGGGKKPAKAEGK